MEIRQLYIDKEAVATLGLLQDGLLFPVTKLMDKQESKIVDETKKYNGITFPFSFILAPNGRRNEEILTTTKENEVLNLVCDNKICGQITTKEVFRIDKQQRIKTIFGTQDLEHHGVKDTNKRLGNYAICGDFKVEFDDIKRHKDKIVQAIKATGANDISSMMVSGKPFHRIHEQLIRMALSNCDLMVLFILKPYKDELLSYETRKKTIEYFCNNYLPKDKVVVVPLENTYIFGGFSELVLNAIVAKNFGCDKLIVGQNQTGLGAFYCKGSLASVADNIKDIGIKIDIMSEFVYCDQCSTLISENTCPHGHHHHINYHSASILGLLELGIIPPAILMRKEISSIILSDLFPQRQARLSQIQQHLSPSSSLLDDFDSKNFYENLIDLYQTSSLT